MSNVILIDRAQDGYVITYLAGSPVNLRAALNGVKDESELVDILKGEGVREISIAEALGVLRTQVSATISFDRQTAG